MPEPFAVFARKERPAKSAASEFIIGARGIVPQGWPPKEIFGLSTEMQDALLLCDTQQKRDAALKIIREERERCQKESRIIGAKLATLGRMRKAFDPFIAWLESGDKSMQRCEDSGFHKLQEAVASESVWVHGADNENLDPEIAAMVASETSIFLVQHDWEKAFENASGMTGEWRLPFEQCAFEFRYGDYRFVVIVCAEDGSPLSVRFFAQMKFGVWSCSVLYNVATGIDWGSAAWRPFAVSMFAQIRALCIALDAEVASTEVIRADHKMNAARAKIGKPPLPDYHTVSVSKKSSRAPDVVRAGGEPRYRVRLHFRRGHWRHFENHKTWIKWMMVGNPDLGFVEKHYLA
jgi:hypothetical protein